MALISPGSMRVIPNSLLLMWGVVGTGAIAVFPAQAQSLPLCYFKTARGEVVNLSRWCTARKSVTAQLSSVLLPIPSQALQQSILSHASREDQQFLNQIGGLPKVLPIAQQLCAYIQQGATPEESMQTVLDQYFGGSADPTASSRLVSLANQVGRPLYCPSRS